MKTSYPVRIALSLLLLILVDSSSAQNTAFTYQGRLNNGGGPASGVFDFRFRLSSDAFGNTYVGTAFTNGVAVTNGLFTVVLDFGGGIFNGENLWLEVDVRTNGAGAYTVLDPLQPFTSAPYALYSAAANSAASAVSVTGPIPDFLLSSNVAFLKSSPNFTGAVSAASFAGNGSLLSGISRLDGANGGPSNALTVDQFGRVAIGTNNSGASLQVAGGGLYSNPAAPKLIYALTNNSHGITNMQAPVDVFVVGTTAYVASFSPGSLEIIDVSNPQNPVLLGEAVDYAAKPGSPFSLNGAGTVFVTNNIAYVSAENANVLSLIDVSNPANPVSLSQITNGVGGYTGLNLPTGVIVSGANAFVLGFSSSALTVIDISNPRAPHLVTQIFDDSVNPASPFTKLKNPYQMTLSGTNLYIAARGDSAVTVVDISNPASPQLQAEIVDASVNPSSPFTKLQQANWVDVSGNVAYVAAGAFSSSAGSLTLIDISNPHSPVRLAEITDASLQAGSPFTKLKGAWGVRVAGATAFVTSFYGNAVTVIDVSDPYYPRLLQELVNGANGITTFEFTEGLTISGDTLYVNGDSSAALNLLDLRSQLGLDVNQFVGIGTAAPRSALDVAGTVMAQALDVSGPVRADGDGEFANVLSHGNVVVDGPNANNGSYSPGLIFGEGSGEAIASKRTSSGNQFGLDFYTAFQPRMSIANNGGVGIGTQAPSAQLHVSGSGGNFFPEAQLDQTNPFDYARLRFTVGGNYSTRWDLGAVTNTFLIFSGFLNATMLQLDSSGLTVHGTFVSSSDRNAKENFETVNVRDALAKVVSLPITSWNFKQDPAIRHIGPMAQDFRAAFNLGGDDKHIATVDAEGVALAAIQGLNQKLDEKDAEIQALKAKNAGLEKRLERLETLFARQNSPRSIEAR